MWKLQSGPTVAALLLTSLMSQTQGFSIGSTVSVNHSLMQTKSSPTYLAERRKLTVLRPHSFSGYDASQTVNYSRSWTPSQAAEFVMHSRQDHLETGMQLAPMIKSWDGEELSEFLSRLFLGQVNGEKVEYSPANVRNPQWVGLGDEGIAALKTLLVAALPESILTTDTLVRCAYSFLLAEHKWPQQMKVKTLRNGRQAQNAPASNAPIVFENDTFAGQGYTKNFAEVLGYVFRQRVGEFESIDVIRMLNLPEQKQKEKGYTVLPEFFDHLGIKLTKQEKVDVVEQLAVSGWPPSTLAKFVCTIQELDERVVTRNTVNTSSTVVSTVTSVTTEVNAPGPSSSAVPASYVPDPSASIPQQAQQMNVSAEQ